MTTPFFVLGAQIWGRQALFHGRVPLTRAALAEGASVTKYPLAHTTSLQVQNIRGPHVVLVCRAFTGELERDIKFILQAFPGWQYYADLESTLDKLRRSEGVQEFVFRESMKRFVFWQATGSPCWLLHFASAEMRRNAVALFRTPAMGPPMTLEEAELGVSTQFWAREAHIDPGALWMVGAQPRAGYQAGLCVSNTQHVRNATVEEQAEMGASTVPWDICIVDCEVLPRRDGRFPCASDPDCAVTLIVCACIRMGEHASARTRAKLRAIVLPMDGGDAFAKNGGGEEYDARVREHMARALERHVAALSEEYRAKWAQPILEDIEIICPRAEARGHNQHQCEVLVLREFAKLVRDFNPDVISGYNLAFDLCYLMDRAAFLGHGKLCDMWAREGFMVPKAPTAQGNSNGGGGKSAKKATRDTDTLRALRCMPGRLVLDMFTFIRKPGLNANFTDCRSFSLKHVAEDKFPPGKGFHQKWDVDPGTMRHEWCEAEGGRVRMLLYCCMDVLVTVDLFDMCSPMSALIALASVTKTTPADYLEKGPDNYTTNLLARRCAKAGYYMNCLRVSKPFDAAMDAVVAAEDDATLVLIPNASAYDGALVLPPKPGVHKFVCVFDVNALYPRMMIRHGTSYESLLDPEDPECAVMLPVARRFVVSDDGSRPDVLMVPKEEVPEPIVSSAVEECMNERTAVRARQKACAGANAAMQWAALEGLQLALKIVANGTYGYTGNQNGKIQNTSLGAVITAGGRDNLKLMVATATAHRAGNAVLYGDTDSAFVGIAPTPEEPTVQACVPYAHALCAELMRATGLKIEVEKIFEKLFLFQEKKHYAGSGISGDGSKPYETCKGIMGKHHEQAIIDARIQGVHGFLDADGDIVGRGFGALCGVLHGFVELLKRFHDIKAHDEDALYCLAKRTKIREENMQQIKDARAATDINLPQLRVAYDIWKRTGAEVKAVTFWTVSTAQKRTSGDRSGATKKVDIVRDYGGLVLGDKLDVLDYFERGSKVLRSVLDAALCSPGITPEQTKACVRDWERALTKYGRELGLLHEGCASMAHAFAPPAPSDGANHAPALPPAKRVSLQEEHGRRMEEQKAKRAKKTAYYSNNAGAVYASMSGAFAVVKKQ
jgi:hypothetical protein